MRRARSRLGASPRAASVTSRRALDDMAHQRRERFRSRAERAQRFAGVVRRLARATARALDAEDRWVGRLALRCVLAALAADQRAGVGRVEDVVGDLEGEPDGLAVRGQTLELARRGAAGDR